MLNVTDCMNFITTDYVLVLAKAHFIMARLYSAKDHAESSLSKYYFWNASTTDMMYYLPQ